MATKSYSIANFSQVSTWTTVADPVPGMTTPTTDSDDKSVVFSDIPVGSTINSAYLQATLASPFTGIDVTTVAFSLNGGTFSANSVWDNLGPPRTETIATGYIAGNGTLTVRFRFKAIGTTSPPLGSRSSSLAYSDITVNVDYTPPYTAPSVTNVYLDYSASNQYRAANTDLTLSWTGNNGSYNTIQSYNVYWNNGTLLASGVTSPYTNAALDSSGTAGASERWYVIAIGEYSNSAAAYSPYVYTYSNPTAPTAVSISPTSVYTNSSEPSLSWSGAGAGVGVSIASYNIYQNGGYLKNVASSPTSITIPAAGSYTYTVMAIGNVSGYNSSASSASASLTVTNPASSFTLNKSSIEMAGSGTSATIGYTITPADGTYRHNISWSVPGISATTYNDVANTGTFIAPISWCTAFLNTISGTATCVVTTKNSGGTTLGTKTLTFTVTVPTSIIPSVSIASKTPYHNPVITNFTTRYIQGISKCTVDITEAGHTTGGGTIASRLTTIPGSSGTTDPWTSGILNTVGSNEINATVTDSRGRTASATPQTITVLAYSAPTISVTNVKRCNSSGTLVDDGTYVKITATASATAIAKDTTGTNVIVSFTFKYRIIGASSWSTEVIFTSDSAMGNNNLLAANGYEILLTTIDSIGTTSTSLINLGPTIKMFDFRNDRAGIGRLAVDTKTLMIPDDWTTNLRINYPVGAIYMSVVSTSPATLFGGTWAALGERFLVGVGTGYANGATGGAATHTLLTGELPRHNHVGFSVAGYGWLNGTGWSARPAGYDFMTVSTGGQNGETGYTGADSPHNNLPPYLAVYMWKRTA